MSARCTLRAAYFILRKLESQCQRAVRRAVRRVARVGGNEEERRQQQWPRSEAKATGEGRGRWGRGGGGTEVRRSRGKTRSEAGDKARPNSPWHNEPKKLWFRKKHNSSHRSSGVSQEVAPPLPPGPRLTQAAPSEEAGCVVRRETRKSRRAGGGRGEAGRNEPVGGSGGVGRGGGGGRAAHGGLPAQLPSRDVHAPMTTGARARRRCATAARPQPLRLVPRFAPRCDRPCPAPAPSRRRAADCQLHCRRPCDRPFVGPSAECRGYFWHVTDLHFDDLYREGGDPAQNCHEADKRASGRAAGRFGDEACDAPWALVESATRAMKAKHGDVEFVLWTGLGFKKYSRIKESFFLTQNNQLVQYCIVFYNTYA
ncbi:Phosphoesterase 24, partial [Gryllus bimaculatus]